MSDDSKPTSEVSGKSQSGVARRSKPRPQKKPKPAGAGAEVIVSSSDAAFIQVPPKSSQFPEFPAVQDTSVSTDWPEPEPASVGTSAASENPKRKRRRKKGKANHAQNPVPSVDAEVHAKTVEETEESSLPQPKDPSPRQNPPPRPKLDPQLLAKCAWKIFLAEISEEGVALVSDSDAKELSRRCFRLAEIFMEEQARRR